MRTWAAPCPPCVESASSDKPRPDILPAGRKLRWVNRKQPLMKNENKMKMFRLSVAFTLICFALSPSAHAVVPAPDGGYPGANTAEGEAALLALTTGTYDTAVGYFSLLNNTTGSYNTALGAATLAFNTTAQQNTAIGAGALLSNTSGDSNTAVGSLAMLFNTVGLQNTAVGGSALSNNIQGYLNTAVGWRALYNNIGNPQNTEGHDNTGVGAGALHQNTTGLQNTAVGSSALYGNNGMENTALGYIALSANTSGNFNTAVGAETLNHVTSGSNNVALGTAAGFNLTTGDNNIDIGADAQGVAGESNTIRIGDGLPNTAGASACYIGGISGQTATSGTAVYIDTTGKLGTITSSARFKHDIKPMADVSETLLALRPVTFRYKKEIDAGQTPQFGLVAEDVEKVNPDLVLRDASGKVNTVRYEAVNAMLLNEFLKEHRRVQELESTVAKQEASAAKQDAAITQQQKQIDALTAGLQRVSAQVELSKSKPQTVLNNQ